MADDNTTPDNNLPPAPADVTEVKDSWLWIKDSKGYGSVTVTFMTVAFWVTTLAYILSIVDHIGPVQIRPFDVAACSAYFIPILTLYFGRKWTEAKMGTGPGPKTGV
jgi:hypothetical protein